MLDPNSFFLQRIPIGCFDAPITAALLAYGPAPGVELIPYFLGLVAWVGLAFVAFLLAPFSALLRWLRGDKGKKAMPKNEEREAVCASLPKSGEKLADKTETPS